MLGLFGPQIRVLQRQRDRRLADWRRRHPARDALEDRALEAMGSLAVVVSVQTVAVSRALGRPGRQPRLTGR